MQNCKRRLWGRTGPTGEFMAGTPSQTLAITTASCGTCQSLCLQEWSAKLVGICCLTFCSWRRFIRFALSPPFGIPLAAALPASFVGGPLCPLACYNSHGGRSQRWPFCWPPACSRASPPSLSPVSEHLAASEEKSMLVVARAAAATAGVLRLKLMSAAARRQAAVLSGFMA